MSTRPSAPRLAAVVLAARERLAEGRDKLKQQHERGTPGIQVSAQWTELLDELTRSFFDEACAEAGLDGQQVPLSLVAHGGFGRRDMAPFSDLDLMLLVTAEEARWTPLARRLTQHIYDSGLALGFSFRTAAEACKLAWKDATICSSLAESRWLAGSEDTFHSFWQRFRRDSQRRWRRLIPALEQARVAERHQFGETVYLLEPNVKRSRGGLRDIQTVRWAGFARYGEVDPEALARQGVLSDDDRKLLRDAREFLLRLRNELHFQAGKAQDLLTKDEQLRIAQAEGYQGGQGLLPVEAFMKRYFELTEDVRYAAAHFLASVKPRAPVPPLLRSLVSHRVGRDFLVGPVHIRATSEGLQKVCSDLAEVLRLMELANLYDKRIDHDTWTAIRDAMAHHDREHLPGEAAKRFLSLISQPGRLGDLLRRLHQLRVLENIVPAMRHARCLLQFNEYHKYTVDEHSIRAVECATDFLHDRGPVGEAYRGLASKRVLHLALLLHDLGKGYEQDHCDVGVVLADETARRLALPEAEGKTLKFLVHKHLVMAHMAFRQDLNDQSTSIRLAVEVGSPDVLQMLYVLTAADLAAVGPGVLNNWKVDLLTQLYYRTRVCLTSDSPSRSLDRVLRERRDAVHALVPKPDEDRQWWSKQIEQLPTDFLMVDPPQQIVEALQQLRRIPHPPAVAWGRYLPERNAVAYTVGTHEEVTPGIFHKLTGALSGKGQQILSAEIHTLADNLVLDRFYVEDMDFSGAPPAEHIQQIVQALLAALEDDRQPSFRRVWKSHEQNVRMSDLPTQVRFDNNTSQAFTIVTIFAYDRRGLLYDIARTLFEMGLSVHVAKIGTYLDQVVDVFYVDDQGGKILNDQRQEQIRQALLAAIDTATNT